MYEKWVGNLEWPNQWRLLYTCLVEAAIQRSAMHKDGRYIRAPLKVRPDGPTGSYSAPEVLVL